MTTDFQRGVRALLCTEEGTLQTGLDADDIDQFIKVESNLLWLDIDTSITKDLSLLKREFGFHDLALEDAIRPHQRSKIDTYDGFTFLVFYTINVGQRRIVKAHTEHPLPTPGQQDEDGAPARRALLRMQQVAMFVGANYLVTVHHGRAPEIEEIAERWRGNIETINRSIGSLLYSLLDTIVDGYFPVIDYVADLVEDIEESVFERF